MGPATVPVQADDAEDYGGYAEWNAQVHQRFCATTEFRPKAPGQAYGRKDAGEHAESDQSPAIGRLTAPQEHACPHI